MCTAEDVKSLIWTFQVDSRLFEYTSWETSGVVCDWTVDTAYVCWPETAVRSRGGWRTVWSSGRRVAFFRLYIDTVMNAKFGECAYTLSSQHIQTGMIGRKTFTIHLCAVCVVYSSLYWCQNWGTLQKEKEPGSGQMRCDVEKNLRVLLVLGLGVVVIVIFDM